ncbi:MAG: M1 family metallopeptidase, partial [Bacteroidales bacterium]
MKYVDFEHLTAIIRIDPEKQFVEGNASFQFRQIRTGNDTLKLYTPSFSIKNVILDKAKIDWEIIDQNLTIILPESAQNFDSHNISIDYETQSATELHYNGWDDTTHTLRKQIWAHRPASWLPFANDRLTVDMIVTFDSAFKVFSNGIRESVITNQDGSKTWHYKMQREHPFFSTALVIGNYDYQSFTMPDGLPVELWYYPDQADHLEPTYQYMTEMIQYFEAELGVPYPYELYREAPVVNYLYGAMETTTSTVFGDYMFIDDRAYWERNYINVNAHELSHQWFGNYISHLRHADVWLTETFATYYAKMFEKSVFGDDYYQWERMKEYERVMKAAQKDSYGIGNSQAGSDRWYPKGSLVMDMLRDILGETDFKRSVTAYLTKHGNSEVWTPDLIKVIHETTGQSVDWFFDQWIERGGEPNYQISYEEQNDRIIVNIRQIQEINALRPVFMMPVEYEFSFTDGTKTRLTKWNKEENQQIVVNKKAGQKLSYFLFDPNNKILKKTRFERSNEFLMNQLAKSENMVDRFEALKALDRVPLDMKRKSLLEASKIETFHLMKAEILRQLATDSTVESLSFFHDCMKDKEVLVRRAALNECNEIHAMLIPEIALCLLDTSYSNIVLALNNLAKMDPKNMPEYLRVTKDEIGYPGKLVRIAWLQNSVIFGDKSFENELITYSGTGYEFMTRINAIRALVALNCFNETVASNIIEATQHWNTKLRPVAIEALTFFNRHISNKMVIENAVKRQVSEKLVRENLMKKINQ